MEEVIGSIPIRSTILNILKAVAYRGDSSLDKPKSGRRKGAFIHISVSQSVR